MKRTLVELLVCLRCRGRLVLEAYRIERLATVPEIDEGALHCPLCSATFPIVAGIPRLLSPPLLAHVKTWHPRFFAEHPNFEVTESEPGELFNDTLVSFTRKRLDLELQGQALAGQWRTNLERNLGDRLPLHKLHGRLILDVGCGFGRHMQVASCHGAEVVGLDLSGGVEIANRYAKGRWQCHVVQANILDRPLRDDCFDVVWSFGALHHMPDPAAAFRAIVPFARRNAGTVAIWVYGYSGMAFTYRMSHMRALRTITQRLSSTSRVRAAEAVAAALSTFYWEPLRALRGFGFVSLANRLPLRDYIDHSWRARVAGVHDRLSTPITHFHDREEIAGWFRSADLADVLIEDTDRRGWRASGQRVGQLAPQATDENATSSPLRHD